MIVSRNILKRGNECRLDIPVGLQLSFRTSLHAAVEEHCATGLAIEVFDDSDKVGADVVFLHGCAQSCKPDPVKGLLEVYEDVVEVLLVLKMFLTKDS